MLWPLVPFHLSAEGLSAHLDAVSIDGNLDISGTFTSGSHSALFYQNGATITGSYAYAGTQFTVEATLNGYIVTGLIRQVGSPATTFALSGAFSPDAQTFTGTTGYVGAWTGTRQAGVSMRITPSMPKIQKLGDAVTYVAEVAGSPNKSVTWSATARTIADGVYTVPSGYDYTAQTVTATAVADISKKVTAQAYISPTEQFEVSGNWKDNVYPTYSVVFYQSGTSLSGLATNGISNFVLDGTLNASSMSLQATNGSSLYGYCTLTISPDGNTITGYLNGYGTIKWTRQAGVSMRITPSTSKIQKPGDVVTYVAEVAGSPNKSATWSATAGTIADGVYTVPSGYDYTAQTVTATAVADISKKVTAQVYISPTGQFEASGNWKDNVYPTYSIVLYQNGTSLSGLATNGISNFVLDGTLNAFSMSLQATNGSSLYGYCTLTISPDGNTITGNLNGYGTIKWTRQAGVSMRITPSTPKIQKPGDVVTYVAEVAGSPNKSVIWSSTAGTVVDGVYTVPSGYDYTTQTVTATAVADISKKVTAQVYISPTGQFEVSGNWKDNVYPTYSIVLYQNGTSLSGLATNGISNFVLDGTLNASSMSLQATNGNSLYGYCTLTISPDGNTITGNLNGYGTIKWTRQPGISMRITPSATKALKPGETQAYVVEVAGSPNKAVTWTATAGAITSGIYTAPSQAGTYTITATSVADARARVQSQVYVNTWKLPYAFWNFDEGIGIIADDASGHGFSGTLYNGAAWAPGKAGKGLALDGKASYVGAPFISLFNRPFTVSAWLNLAAVNRSVDNPILFHGTTTTDHGLALYERGGKAYFDFYSDGIASTSTLPVNQWVHVAFTYDGSSRRIYINGVLDVTQACNPYLGIGASLTFGQWPWATQHTFLGTLDEVQIFDHAMVDAEVAALYASTVNITISPRSATLAIGQSKTFSATVTGHSDTTATWELPDASSGSVTPQGIYTAPATVATSGATYRVLARSVGDITQIDTVNVTVKPFVRVTPETVSLAANGTYPFQAEVTGLANAQVIWSATSGSFNGNTYRAPSTTGTFTITATSVADGTKIGTATVKVVAGNVPDNAGLVGYWKFDDNALDSSGLENNGTPSGGVTYAAGQTGSAAHFDGVASAVDIPSVNPFMGTFTVCAWVKFDAINKATHNPILSHGTTGTNQGLHLSELNGKPYFGFSYNDLVGNKEIKPNTWTHLAFVFDGVQKRIYVNGILDATQNSVAYQSPLTNAQIGRISWSPTHDFLGLIDDVQIYNRALSDVEITGVFATRANVAITPRTAVVAIGKTQAFSAFVSGNANPAVTWSLPTANTGTIDQTGLYTPPATIAYHGITYTIKAASQAVATQTDSVLVTVKYPVYVMPRTLTIPANGTATFSAETTGLASDQVNWTTTAGSITSAGVFTAPATTGTVTITATSATDGTALSTATVTVEKANASADVLMAFDEGAGTTTQDSMGSGIVGTLSNGPVWVAGKIGKALDFQPTNAMVTLNPAVSLGKAWTISAWFKYPFPSTGTWHTLTRGVNGDHQIIIHNDQITLGSYDSSYGFRSSGFKVNSLSAGWHHVAAVAKSGVTQFFMDGQSVGNAIPWQSATDIYAIGNYQGGGQSFGVVDEVRIFLRALSQAEIGSLASGIQVQVIPAVINLSPGSTQTFTTTILGGTTQAVTWELPDQNSGSITSEGVYTAPDYLPYEGVRFRVVARSTQDTAQTAVAWVTVASANPIQLPLLHLPFNEGTGDQTMDASGHGFRGYLVNGATWEPAGKVGNAVRVNGTQILKVPSLPAMRDALSVSIWIYPTDKGIQNPEGGTLVCREGEFLLARFQDGTIRYVIANTSPGWVSPYWINTGFVAPLNQWSHIVWTYSSVAGLLKVFANGVEVHSRSGSGLIGDVAPSLNEFWIGGRQYTNQNFQGLLDEVRVYNRAIAPIEVAALFNLNAVEIYPAEGGVDVGKSIRFQAFVPNTPDQSVTWELPVANSGTVSADGTYTAPSSILGGDTSFPLIARSVADTTRTGTGTIRVRGFANLDPALVGYWGFNESIGTTVLDQSRFSNHGTIQGGIVNRTSGRIGNGLAFDGANGQVVIPDHPALNPQSLTLSLWLRLDKDPAFDSTSNSWRSLLHKGSFYGGSSGYSVALQKDRSISFYTGTGSSDSWNPQGVTLTVGTWSHIVFTYDAVTGLKSAFQDGQLMDTKRVTPLPLQPVSSPLYLNNPSSYLPTSGSGNFPGMMDEFRVYGRALSASDVAALYAEVVSVKVRPQDPVLTTGQTQAFKATVCGSLNQGVNWSTLDVDGGSIDATGLYTAPSTSSQGVRYRIQAQSQADASATDIICVTIKQPVYVSPAAITVPVNGAAAFTAEVTGLSGTQVVWSATAGSISSTGTFIAPSTTGTVTITATSTVDTSKSATAIVTVSGASTVADAYFAFNEGSGTTTGDSSGHGFIGTLVNGPQWVEGRSGKGLDFSANKSLVALSPGVDLGDAWTISTWIQTPIPQTGGYHSLTRGVNFDQQLLIHSDQTSLGLWDSTAIMWRGCGFNITTLSAGWHHVAAVGNAGTTTFYVDGKIAGIPVAYQSKSDVGYLGGNPNTSLGETFGVIDEVKIFRRALGPAEISNLYSTNVLVGLLPASTTLILGQSQTFTATVANTIDKGVTWILPDAGSGSITSEGVYTAPEAIPSEGKVIRILARSQADSTQTATAFVTVRSPVVVSPAVIIVPQLATTSFSAVTTNLASTAVTWSVSSNGGTINAATGAYTAPSTAGTYTITATSVSDATKRGTATVIVPLGISIVPTKTALLTGSNLQFQALVTGASNKSVNWNLWEPQGGSISSSGFYKASEKTGAYHVSAIAQADARAVATAEVTVVKDSTYLVDPESLRVKPGAKVTFKVLGPDVTTAQIVWQTGGGSITAAGVLTAPATTDTFNVVAYVTTDITRVASATVTVATTAPVDSVTVTPAEIDLNKGGTTTFTAQVSGGTTGEITWTCIGGTIDPSTGAYTAPNAFGTYTVKATSTEDNTAYGTATVTVKAIAGTDKTFNYDLNGNLTSDGERTFEWDAENRLVSVTITATGHRTEFGYDGLGRRVEIIEKDPDATQTLQVTSDKKYLWDGVEIAEERSADGATVTKRFYSQGFVDTDGTILYYTRDHLGSVRELTDSSQAVRARYDYDPYGRMTKIQGDKDSVFTYTGHFWHAQSGLNLALFRAYDPNMGRWISRDPLEESDGINTYAYVANNPIYYYDELGLASSDECKELRKKIITKWIKMVYKVAKYDAVEDAIGGHPYFGGTKTTKPHSHYKEIVRWQKELQEQITEYKKKCSDKCDPPGPPARPLPRQVSDDAFNPNLIPPIPEVFLNDDAYLDNPMQLIPIPIPALAGRPVFQWGF